MKPTRLFEIEPRMPVASLAAAYAFYVGVLGFHSDGGAPRDDAVFVILERDGVKLQLIAADSHHPLGKLTLWCGVEDAAAEHQRISSLAPIEWGPEVYWYGCREFAVLDPDGHRIIFSSPTSETSNFPAPVKTS